MLCPELHCSAKVPKHQYTALGEVGNAQHLSPSCFSCQRPSGNNQPPGHLPNSSPVITQPHIYSLSHRDVHSPQHVFTQPPFFFSKPFHKVVEELPHQQCYHGLYYQHHCHRRHHQHRSHYHHHREKRPQPAAPVWATRIRLVGRHHSILLLHPAPLDPWILSNTKLVGLLRESG